MEAGCERSQRKNVAVEEPANGQRPRQRRDDDFGSNAPHPPRLSDRVLDGDGNRSGNQTMFGMTDLVGNTSRANGEINRYRGF